MKIELSDHVVKELEYMLKLYNEHGLEGQFHDPNDPPFDSVQSLVGAILISVANGSRRPQSHERELLVKMGLVANCDAHHVYRRDFGSDA